MFKTKPPSNATVIERHGLFVLFPPPEGTWDVDIVIVHGLGGDAYTTWTADNRIMWPRDFIPQVIPTARVMTFGYDSKWAFSPSTADIKDFALDLLNRLRNKRWSADEMNHPIIFICHSLGGIVCKQALLLARSLPFYTNIFEKTSSILFFGCPHRGSRVASWATVVGNFINASSFHKPIQRDLLADLSLSSQILADISAAFKEIVGDIDVKTFYETAIMLPLKGPVVERDSAVLGLPTEQIIPIAANHREMVRFTSINSEKFDSVKFALREAKEGRPMDSRSVENDVLKAEYIKLRKPPSRDIEQSSRRSDFLAYFFCSERNRHLQSENNILMSILHQLLSAAPDEVAKALQVFRQSSLNYSFLFKPEDLWEAVKSALIAINWTTTYLVFDGLDEMLAEDLDSFSTGLKVLVESVTPQIEPRSLKLLVTSRPLANLDTNFSCPSISVRSERDVRHFVQGSTNELAERYVLPAELQVDIVERISEKAKGMFLWAVLAWYELCRNARRAEDFAANLLELENLPTTLEMLYENILNRLPPSSRQLALKAFPWLTLSARPLHCDELRFAIAMNEATDSFEATVRRMITRQDLKTLCPDLMNIGTDGYVQFARSSIKDFFLCPNTSAQYRIDPVKMHSTIAITCVQSLYLPGFDAEAIQAELTNTQVSSENQMVDLPWRYLLLPYAATNWYYHASMAGEDLKVWTAFKTLLEHGSSTNLWLMLALYDGSLSAQKGWKFSQVFWDYFANPSAIHIAVFLKNTYFIKKLVESGASINERNGRWENTSEQYCRPRMAVGGTVLHTPNLDRELLHLLLNLGADMNAADVNGISALSNAVNENDEDKVVMLLKFAKSRRGHSSVGYDLNILNQASVMTMKKAVLEVLDDPLLDLSHPRFQGKDESILGTYHTTPLEHACLLGMTTMANIMMNHPRMVAAQKRIELRSPNRNPTSVAFLTALQGWDDLTLIALQNFQTDLDRERDMNRRTILMHAAMEEWHYVLEHCVDRLPRSRLNMQDKNGRTALHHAARMRNWFGTDKLLAARADFHMEDHKGMTPAHAAAEAGSDRVLRIMLEQRAFGIDSTDHQKRNILHYVATWNLHSIAETLIEIAPQQVSAKDANGRTPVHLAALFGSTAVLALLLSKGLVDINAQDHVGKTLLHLAVESKIESCIDEFLSREQTDLNMMDRNLRSPHDITQGFKDQIQAESIRIMLEDAGCRPGLWRPRRTYAAYQAVDKTEVEEPIRNPQDWQLMKPPTMEANHPFGYFEAHTETNAIEKNEEEDPARRRKPLPPPLPPRQSS